MNSQGHHASFDRKDSSMGSLKTLALAGAMASVTASYAFAGDLPPAAMPAGVPEAPIEAPSGDDSGLYLRGDLGVGLGQVGNLEVQPAAGGALLDSPDQDMGSTFMGGLGVGYAFNSWLRFDVTGEYRGGTRLTGTDIWNGGPNNVGAVGGTNMYDGNLSTWLGMANAYVDLGTFCELGCITPYVGAGVGYGMHSLTVQDHGAVGQSGAPTSATSGYGKESSSGLAWAVMAGLAYQVNDKLTMDLGYRYLNLGDSPEVDVVNLATGNSDGSVKWNDMVSHDIRIGMRWTLGSGDCCAAAPAPAEPLMRRY
jgi:opacity protein-like surface antigen